jgi:hypothetical protein
VKVDSRLLPVALHRSRSDTSCIAAISPNEKPAREFEVDDLREPRVDRGQDILRVADARELLAVGTASGTSVPIDVISN